MQYDLAHERKNDGVAKKTRRKGEIAEFNEYNPHRRVHGMIHGNSSGVMPAQNSPMLHLFGEHIMSSP